MRKNSLTSLEDLRPEPISPGQGYNQGSIGGGGARPYGANRMSTGIPVASGLPPGRRLTGTAGPLMATGAAPLSPSSRPSGPVPAPNLANLTMIGGAIKR